ncbi:MAG TPA: hypothetical protein PKE12_10760 [Kiritimatiellia bacterium]|nr:hypothetical protein [Kiritimatiellia bacterium]
MRLTVNIPDSMIKQARLQSLREELSLKDWVVARLQNYSDEGSRFALVDAPQFRRRFRGQFSVDEIDRNKRWSRT